MDAKPLLVEIGRHLHDLNLDAVLIGNAAAALQGAPVTTVDFDFLFRKTPRNMEKLKALATALGAVVLRPYCPASELYRVVRDDDGLQVVFMTTISRHPLVCRPARQGGDHRNRRVPAPSGDARRHHSKQTCGPPAARPRGHRGAGKDP